MSKRFVFLFLVILILFTSACGEKQVINSMTPEEMVQYIDKRIDEKVPTQTPKWFSATVISVSNDGLVEVRLSTDDIGNNIRVQNVRELPLEIGDEVYIVAVDSKLTNAFVDVRKNIILNDIYVDYNIGVDDYRHGTEAMPFKTLQYAVNRCPKNINGRNINIYFDNLSLENLVIDNFYGGGRLYLRPHSGTDIKYINSLQVVACNGAVVTIEYLGYKGSSYFSSPTYTGSVIIARSQEIDIFHADITEVSATVNGIIVLSGSNANIQHCVISDHSAAIWTLYNSNVFSYNNSGINNTKGLVADYNSTIGKLGAQPSGSTAEYTSGGSEIR